MDDKSILAIVIAIFVAYITHKFTKKRFRDELRIKKNEKNISDIKDVINEFETKLLERIYFTRSYLYDIKADKVTPEFREKYKDIIFKWNVDFDYRANKLSRFGFINQITKIEDMQTELRDFHSFIVRCMSCKNNTNLKEVDNKIDELKVFQTKCYGFISILHSEVDKKWDRIFLYKESRKRLIFSYLFDCFFKTVICYLLISFVSFFLTGLFH